MSGPDAGQDAPPTRALLGPRLAALVLVLLGIVLVFATSSVGGRGGYDVVGPRFFPLVVAVAIFALGLGLVLRTTVRPDRELAEQAAEEEAATAWPTVGLMGLGLVSYALLLEPLGYVLATALFFPGVARVLGSARPVRDAIVGLVIGAVVYVAFTQFLGVRLPSGLLPSL